MRLITRTLIFALGVAALFSATSTFAATVSNDGIWTRVDASSLRQMAKESDRRLPLAFSAFALNESRLKVVLAQAPEEFTGESQTILELPLPDGTFGRFRIEHSPIVEPGMLDKFPEFGATYRGYGIDDPTSSVRFDLMPSGFHAMVLRAGTTLYVDPYGDSGSYAAYEKTALPSPKDPFICHVGEKDLASDIKTEKFDLFGSGAGAAEVVNGDTLRTYRLAVAATGEYTAFFGGTVANGQSAIVTSMNRVNAIYERELAIRMVLVANNSSVVFTNAATDPYTNNSGSTMLGQNTTTLNSVIGSANYDIGHVFSTGGGGVATLNGPCGASKARGVTGSSAPVGDAFDVDYVAHEIGHQFGGQHTFNGTTGNCGGGNRSGGSAQEPGSGITIMAYAGICGAEDLARNSIDTFAVKSLEQIVAFKEAGGSCGAATSTGNTSPSVTGPGNFTIPAQTPFSLTATATDVNGDTLTYDWQEYDFGMAAPPNTDSDGQARPILRPYSPTTSGTRFFPSLTYILNNANVPPSTYDCGRATPCLTGEILPSLTRVMNFQVIVRDNRANGGGINTATSQVTVSTLSGPFVVTAPNTAGTFNGGGPLNVTWSVNNTTAAPVSAANVQILLSTDGGASYPIILDALTSNDGAHSVTLPNVATNTARIMVRGAGNIFFDVSDANFTIVSSNVTVSGRVFGFGGRPVTNALVTINGPGGPRTTRTNRRGAYSFANVAAGQTYTVSVTQRRFSFTPQTLTINSDLSNLDFTANP